ncbi:membrane protein [Grimontia indica]|uniref:Membrane protein n=1 Tax=Grimontia indica TaxID=1056512 RepID=R1GRT5_9GAMM|nr:MipA/OmpV family protein [Grimontia indica]EOD78809.1 membrane protein [Grimontia indica]
MRKSVISFLSPLLLSVIATPTLAQDKYKDFGFVGAGLTVGESVFSNQGAKAGAEPYLFYNSEHGFIDGSLFTYNPIPFIGLSGNLRFAEVSDDFDDIPSGINNRDGNGELGITLGTVGARLTYLHDVTDEHNGYEIQLHLGRAFDTPITNFVLSPYVEVNYRDEKLSQHLYSISAQESSASGLAEFSADETWVYKGGVVALYDISENWLAISEVALEHHDSDSPLVQNDLGWEFSLGAVYKF